MLLTSDPAHARRRRRLREHCDGGLRARPDTASRSVVVEAYEELASTTG